MRMISMSKNIQYGMSEGESRRDGEEEDIIEF